MRVPAMITFLRQLRVALRLSDKLGIGQAATHSVGWAVLDWANDG
jgi:hypothetical protein